MVEGIAEKHCRQASEFEKIGDWDNAIAEYTRAIKIDPKGARFYNNQGNAYHEKKDYNSTIEDYDRAIT